MDTEKQSTQDTTRTTPSPPNVEQMAPEETEEFDEEIEEAGIGMQHGERKRKLPPERPERNPEEAILRSGKKDPTAPKDKKDVSPYDWKTRRDERAAQQFSTQEREQMKDEQGGDRVKGGTSDSKENLH